LIKAKQTKHDGKHHKYWNAWLDNMAEIINQRKPERLLELGPH
jgi:hypothetical protein